MSQTIDEQNFGPKISVKRGRKSREAISSNTSPTDVSQFADTVSSESKIDDITIDRSSWASTDTDSAYGRTSPLHAVSCIDWLQASSADAVDKSEYGSLFMRARQTYRGDAYTLDEVPGCKIWLKRRRDGTIKFSFNPSQFTKWSGERGLKEALVNTLGRWCLGAVVHRLDIAVTIPESFEATLTGISFDKRRFIDHYSTSTKGRSVYFGRIKNRKEGLLYDKQRQSQLLADKSKRLSYPCTRIEINSVPVRSDRFRINDLPKLVKHRPFKGIIRHKVTFYKPDRDNIKSIQRSAELKLLFKREGEWQAKRTLARMCNRNFERLYGPLYEKIIVKPSLNKIYLAAMKEFFL